MLKSIITSSAFKSFIAAASVTSLMWFTVTVQDSEKYCDDDLYSVTRVNSQGEIVELTFNGYHTGNSGASFCSSVENFPRTKSTRS